MSTSGRVIGLVVTTVMFLFSTFVFTRTGDWVAAVFALGSLGYGLVFLTAAKDPNP